MYFSLISMGFNAYIGKGKQTVNDLAERKGNIGPPEIQLAVKGGGENIFLN